MMLSSPSVFSHPLASRHRGRRGRPAFRWRWTVNFLNFRGRGGAATGVGLYLPAMATPLYNRDILRLAASIPHLGRLERRQASAEKRSPICGSRVAVDVVLDERGRVAELGQEVKACALGQASAALMGANAIGRSAAELVRARDDLVAFLDGGSEDPGAWPGLELFRAARPHKARHPSILLAFDAAAEAASEASLLRLEAGRS